MSLTAENVRFHAAGHLAAAVALANASNVEGARTVLRIVRAYLEQPRVQSPPAFRETLDKAISNPTQEAHNVAALERMFCDPANTNLEQAGIWIGRGE